MRDEARLECGKATAGISAKEPARQSEREIERGKDQHKERHVTSSDKARDGQSQICKRYNCYCQSELTTHIWLQSKPAGAWPDHSNEGSGDTGLLHSWSRLTGPITTRGRDISVFALAGADAEKALLIGALAASRAITLGLFYVSGLSQGLSRLIVMSAQNLTKRSGTMGNFLFAAGKGNLQSTSLHL